MKANTGHWVIIIGLIILGVWLSMTPLYKYPSSTDPSWFYINAVIWIWLIAGPSLIVMGLVLAILRYGRPDATPKKVRMD